MTGLNDTDIRLNSEWQLTQATDGDAPLCSGHLFHYCEHFSFIKVNVFIFIKIFRI